MSSLAVPVITNEAAGEIEPSLHKVTHTHPPRKACIVQVATMPKTEIFYYEQTEITKCYPGRKEELMSRKEDNLLKNRSFY